MRAPKTTRLLALGCAAPLLFWAAVASAQQYPEPPPPAGGYSQPPPGYGGYDPAPPAEQPMFERRGWFAGFEGGVGGFKADGPFDLGEERGAVLFGAHFGGMISPRLGLMVLFAGAGRTLEDGRDYGEDSSLSQLNLGIALQYWASPKLWIKAGLVSSHLSLDEYGETVDETEGGGILAAVGYEVYQRNNFIMDVQLRMVNADHEEDGYLVSSSDSFGILLGCNWY